MPSVSTQTQAIENYIRGDSRIIQINVFQSDGKTPFNLTGCTVFFTVNANSDNTTDVDTSAVIALKTSTFSSPTSGIANLSLTNVITQDITPDVYFYDIQLKDSSGNITSLAQNTFQIIPDVTRSIT